MKESRSLVNDTTRTNKPSSRYYVVVPEGVAEGQTFMTQVPLQTAPAVVQAAPAVAPIAQAQYAPQPVQQQQQYAPQQQQYAPQQAQAQYAPQPAQQQPQAPPPAYGAPALPPGWEEKFTPEGKP